MAANEVKIPEKKRYNVVALASDGSNVRNWMLRFQNMLHTHGLNHMRTEHYAMYVRARATLAINIKAQAERDIKMSRAEHAANDRNAGHIDVKTEDVAAKKSARKATTRTSDKDKEKAEEEAAKEIKGQVSEQVSARSHTNAQRERQRGVRVRLRWR